MPGPDKGLLLERELGKNFRVGPNPGAGRGAPGGENRELTASEATFLAVLLPGRPWSTYGVIRMPTALHG